MLFLESINQFIALVTEIITKLLFGIQICPFASDCYRCYFPFDC